MPLFHRCTIQMEDGTVVAQDLRIAIEEPGREGGPPWYGTLTVSHLTALTAGQTYRLVLDDGRSGRCRVRRNTFAGDVNRAVAVDGMEPFQARA